MNKLAWCKNQAKGIRLVPPNERICEDYFRKSDDALKNLSATPVEDWRIISAYYACYSSLYALLEKTGVKCEIHDCTIALMHFFSFSDEEVNFMKELKENRINAQYYINRKVNSVNIFQVKDFVLKCKSIAHSADFLKIKMTVAKELGLHHQKA